jgi:carboxylate-amine ligase
MNPCPKQSLHLFQGFGVEIEYMIVAKSSLAVLPLCDRVLAAIAGKISSEVEVGEIAWSNELVAHVIELKTNGPAHSLTHLPNSFQNSVNKINLILQQYDAMLLPTGAHPLMQPATDTCLWPHDDKSIYETYNRIFDCKGHGWTNLQSTHLNLPFANEDEFVRLHSAIRLLLPIIPALSASSPILDGKATGFVDTRLEYYRKNQQKIPIITGQVIPEAITSIAEYQEKILQPIYNAIAPYDSNNVLQQEWLNSRGAIARFDRDTIEIRIIDSQESVEADIAILAVITTVLKGLIAEQWSKLSDQLKFQEQYLSSIFLDVIKEGADVTITDPNYLLAFGYDERPFCSVNNLWQSILQQTFVTEDLDPTWNNTIEIILSEGNLSKRIINSLHGNYSSQNIIAIYRKLSETLSNGSIYIP